MRAVEAVRALGDSDGGKDAIAAAIVRRYGELLRGDPAAAHVIIEGEKRPPARPSARASPRRWPRSPPAVRRPRRSRR
jgi:hypothetical protein